MKRRLRASSYWLIGLMVVAAVVLIISSREERLFVILLPVICSSCVLVLGGIQLAREILADGRPEIIVGGEEVEGVQQDKADVRKYLVTGAWIVGIVIAIYLLGFLIAIPLFVLSYIKWAGKRWRTAVIFSASTAAIIYYGFSILLRIRLYEGLLLSFLKGF